MACKNSRCSLLHQHVHVSVWDWGVRLWPPQWPYMHVTSHRPALHMRTTSTAFSSVFTRTLNIQNDATNRWSNRAGAAGAPTPTIPIEGNANQCKERCVVVGSADLEHAAAAGDDRSVHPPTRSAIADSFQEILMHIISMFD